MQEDKMSNLVYSLLCIWLASKMKNHVKSSRFQSCEIQEKDNHFLSGCAGQATALFQPPSVTPRPGPITGKFQKKIPKK